ncbi:hypothetical protein KGF56_000010 [Candida oxycetoniae]|uniref:Uncharacterized protein n=1 Tax=Candida oxycetoniae TaxID=497107 RepID=A0AAI9X0J8_9ASCO|nr:uncharacterized protein KGF56_000010 [Candida oxycetoniae]KAI3407170.1 hypothetical protein KGF56_000010 [Candida oxycetoniae]
MDRNGGSSKGMSKNKASRTNNNNGHYHHHQWVQQLRALPSDPNSKDLLKLEYIDVNLNNSRKLINNVYSLNSESAEYAKQLDKHLGSLPQLDYLVKELDWLNNI